MTDTDLTSHHIEGYLPDGRPLKVPLISEIAPDFWMGGCRDGVVLPDDFKFVVSLYPWERFSLAETTQRLEFRLYDSDEMPDEDLLRSIARLVNALRKIGKTLVHCQAGLNRSGLVAALVLASNGPMNAHEAIALLRVRRCPLVLCNETFESWLLESALA